MDRRSFIKYTAVTAAISGVPTIALGQNQPGGAPAQGGGRKLRVAGIGVGGMGAADLSQIAQHPDVTIVGLCDVDRARVAKAGEQHADAKQFADYREMLETLGDDVDAVHVSTPDHTHAHATMLAMNMGKHVYTQKPLTHDIYEARQLAKVAAANPKIVTQMGTQNASRIPKRQALAVLKDPALREQTVGRVTAIYGWSDRPAGWWPQGNPRPEGEDPVPADLSWDLWIGTAPMRPYKNGQYAPFNWRGTYDFGCGALGDMACHIMDTAYYALDLGHARSVVSHNEDSTDDQFPTYQHSVLVFAGNDASDGKDIGMYWFDGGIIPHHKALGIPQHANLPDNGCVVVGDRGSMLITHVGEPPRLFDKESERDLAPMLPSLEERNHYHHWVDACLGRTKTECNFEVAGPLIEQLCLGAISARFPHKTLLWDAESMKFTNSDEANKLVRRKYRDGWEIENL